MSDVRTFALPDVGEGLTEAEILTWHVKPGDTVTVNQTIVEIETAKAAVELPCPFAGVVAEVFVAEGDVVPVGTPILSITTAGSAPAAPDVTPAPAAAAAAPAPAIPHEGAPGRDRGVQDAPTGVPAVASSAPTADEPEGREPVLVGYGVRQTGVPHRRQRVLAQDPHGTTAPEAGPPGEAAKPVRHGGLEVGRHAEEVLSRRSPVLAKPPVRRLAKDLQVDLAVVDPTGAGGVITRADVERTAMLAVAVRDEGRPSRPYRGLGHLHAERTEPREVRTPIKGVTKLMAEAMVASAFTAPHVTEWVEVDVTRSLELVERLRVRPEFEGVKVSPLLLVATGLIRAARHYPGINATWDS
ncbi:MAG TPA: biotin/lipoyl-containing protein, partial [Candidatus Angelobacter sp.]|nr:biotin/lipoyl-containing protein [Candidatus Angelobacter sp.]